MADECASPRSLREPRIPEPARDARAGQLYQARDRPRAAQCDVECQHRALGESAKNQRGRWGFLAQFVEQRAHRHMGLLQPLGLVLRQIPSRAAGDRRSPANTIRGPPAPPRQRKWAQVCKPSGNRKRPGTPIDRANGSKSSGVPAKPCKSTINGPCSSVATRRTLQRGGVNKYSTLTASTEDTPRYTLGLARSEISRQSLVHWRWTGGRNSRERSSAAEAP